MARAQKKAAANGGTGTSTPKAEDSSHTTKEALFDAPVSTSVTTEKPSSTNGSGSHETKHGSNAYTREIEKRLAKWSKKKRGIETIEAKISGLTPQEQEITKLINIDEKKKLAEKPLVEERAKEYQELLTSMTAIATSEDKAKVGEKEAADADVIAKVEEAKKAGFEEGLKAQKDVLLTCFRFLRLAGYRRAVPDDNAAENEAIEKVLVMVYSSEDSATAAIESLAASKEEAIEGSEGITSETVPPPPPPQTLTDVVETTPTAPATTMVDDGAANAAAVAHTAEGTEHPEDWDNINAGGQSSDNGGSGNKTPATSWADQSLEESSKDVATPPAEEAFQEVPSRSHGNRGRNFRGRGEFRGNFRGGPRGGFRGRGEGFRGRGEFRGERGNFRGGRGDRPFRPRGDRGGHEQAPATAPAPAPASAPTV
ncbi:hypothetical protein ABW20_dc0106349 [Dactylellina cionopaga]|nr:hypothetical protein ABW20_dc0106349 [Dactylellina cionopaga]